jgi:hypothetical protein
MNEARAKLAFTFLDTSGNTLTFDKFQYERAYLVGDEYDDNWLSCRITLHATIRHSVMASLLTSELKALAVAVRSALEAKEAEFEPVEPWISLKLSRSPGIVLVDATLTITLGDGPDISFGYECREAEVRVTLEDIERVIAAIPPR